MQACTGGQNTHLGAPGRQRFRRIQGIAAVVPGAGQHQDPGADHTSAVFVEQGLGLVRQRCGRPGHQRDAALEERGLGLAHLRCRVGLHAATLRRATAGERASPAGAPRNRGIPTLAVPSVPLEDVDRLKADLP